MPEFDFFSDQMVMDPYPVYKKLREEAPVYQDPASKMWILSKYDDVYAALRNHKTFSSTAMGGGGAGGFPMISDDPPRHSRLRSLVNRAFTPTMIGKIEPFIKDVSDDLLQDIGSGEVEIVERLTIPLPVIVIAKMLGIAEKDKERFKHWSDALTGLLGGDQREGMQKAIMEMFAYFGKEIEKRRSEPLDDLIAAVVNAEVDGESLNDQEVIGFCLLILIAGNETTTNLLGNALNILADHPDIWQRLREDRTLIDRVVEETLRFDSPVQFIYRALTEDVEIRGMKLEKGDRAIVGFASANRDSDNFDDADEFKVDRDLKRHMAFGHGIHFCLGAPLARVEARIGLTALLDRFETLKRGSTAGVRVPSHLLRGFASLPIELS